MKKKMICGLAFLSMSALLTGCHMKHEWVEATCVEPRTCSVGGETEGEPLGHTWAEATCTEPRTCSVCGETEGEALDHEWVEATYDAPKTCSVCSLTEGESLPKPYFLEEGIVCEELRDLELPINMTFLENDEPAEIDGLRLEYDNGHYTFGEIISEPAQQEGCITVTIPYEINFSFTIYYDESVHSGPYFWNYSYNTFNLCDYYTGVKMLTVNSFNNAGREGSKEIEWEGKTYSIGCAESSNADGETFDWVWDEGSIYHQTREVTQHYVLTVTVSEDYDGAVLYIGKNDSDFVLETTQDGGGTGDIGTGDRYIYDGGSPEDFMFFRLSDLIQ